MRIRDYVWFNAGLCMASAVALAALHDLTGIFPAVLCGVWVYVGLTEED
jgi:hypothetical protein